MLQRIIGFFDSIRPGRDIDKLQKEDKLTIRRFEEMVWAQFEDDMEDFVGGRVIQFPMVFDIMLCPDDYKRLKQGIPGVLPELISGFYGRIKERKAKISGAVVKNVNRYWLFTYSESDGWSDEDGNFHKITKGEVIVQAALYGSDIRAEEDGIQIDSRSSVTSVWSSKSGVGSLSGTAINLEILEGGHLHANRQFSFDFDRDLNQDLERIEQSRTVRDDLAVLTWESVKNGKKSGKPFLMKENTITISGPKDTRKNNPSGIVIIDDDIVEKDHVQIRYNELSKRFEMCAFADGVRLNQIAVPISQGQIINWTAMSNKSTIIIRNYITIKFVGK